MPDDEARDRASFDARWKVALGVEMEERQFSTSTLRAFRQGLSVDPVSRHAFERALAYLRAHGFAVIEEGDEDEAVRARRVASAAAEAAW